MNRRHSGEKGPWHLKGSGWLLAMALALSCAAPPPIAALTDCDCPSGAGIVGAAPPAGILQRCELPGGVRHGKSRAWYDNGRLRYETEWWQGTKHGRFTFWYASGQKRAEGQDRRGIPDGKWISWADDGTVLQERVFKAPTKDVAAEKPEAMLSVPARPLECGEDGQTVRAFAAPGRLAPLPAPEQSGR